MTKGHIKESKSKDGKSPFDLLREYEATGDLRWANLFRVYASAFHGRKQLSWSHGLKKRLAVQDKTDDEVAKEEEELAELFASISDFDWKLVLCFKAESQLLESAELGRSAFNDFLHSLRLRS